MFISLNSSEFALIIVGAGAAGPPFGPIGTCRERHERLPEPFGVLDAFRSSSPSRSELLADAAPDFTDLALRLSTKLPSSARMKNTIAKQGLQQRQLWRK